jgi:transcriptional regulator with PAS, ATPase and Fis domain
MMKALLTFTGFHDPFSPTVVEKRKQAGPILSLVDAVGFDRIILFDTPGTAENTKLTLEALRERAPDLPTEVHSAPNLADPTDHLRILAFLRKQVPPVLKALPDAEFFISISSGTPSMHACWLLLVADGTIPARIIYGHPPRHAEDDYRVSEVDLSSDEFPEIKPRVFQKASEPEQFVPDLQATCQTLGIVGTDNDFLAALDRSARVSRYDSHVLILGETGTGKEQVAKLIHHMSPRARGPFVVVNCAAFPKELVESMLFGHKKGAFTGATKDQTGEFDNAHGGTLFLDEIAELPTTSQSKLLRVLQDGRIKPLGAQKEHTVNVRVVAATNADVQKAVRDETFRLDLANRFPVRIELPPLRSRRGDIIRLATYALQQWNKKHGENRRLSRQALVACQKYAWPGNVRELMSAVETAAMLARGATLQADDLQLQNALSQGNQVAAGIQPYEGFSLKQYLNEIRQSLMLKALKAAGGNGSRAARLLSISPQAVHKFLKEQEERGSPVE